MNKIIFTFILIFILSCEKQEPIIYDIPQAGIQFYLSDSDIEAGADTKLEQNFAFMYEQQGWNTYYFGDRKKTDTISLVVSFMGYKSDTIREFRLKMVDLRDSTLGLKQSIKKDLDTTSVKFMNPYFFGKNQSLDTVKIVLLRPKQRGHYQIGVTFDTEFEGSMFAKGVKEQAVYRMFLSDRYEKPGNWDRELKPFVGEFSEEKYAFMVTSLNTKDFYSWQFEWSGYLTKLKEALEEYNREHPDNPKDFTF